MAGGDDDDDDDDAYTERLYMFGVYPYLHTSI